MAWGNAPLLPRPCEWAGRDAVQQMGLSLRGRTCPEWLYAPKDNRLPGYTIFVKRPDWLPETE